jgi:hypothetical protein
MFLDNQNISIIVRPSRRGKWSGIKITEEKREKISITKEITGETRIEYMLPQVARELIKRQMKEKNPILSKTFEKWIENDTERLGCQMLNHPLLQTKVIVPNHVSEYGRIKNYRIARDIWEEILIYEKK